MKKHYILIAIIIGIAIIFFGVSINNVKAMSETSNISEAEEVTFILTDYKGRIALFKSNNETPVKVFDVFTQSLPESDIKSIKEGIRVKEENVEKILEEYLS